MNAQNSLARITPATGLTPRSMAEAVTLAEYAAKSGLCAVREPAQALVVLMTGMELGLSPMQSFRGIHVVNGKPVLSADLLVAIVRSSGICKSWLTVESTIDRCTIETHREGDATPVRKTWTAEDAKRAGLATQVWRSYPAQMLRHRCAADLAREVYADLAMGCYTPDEVSDGRVSDADVERITVTREQPAESATVAALELLSIDLVDAADLAAIAATYQRHSASLGGTSAAQVHGVVRTRTADLGYHLTAAETQALCGGTLDADLTAAYESLVAIAKHADDESGDGVIAEVVRVLRRCGSMHKTAKARVMAVAIATAEGLGVEAPKHRITLALKPTPPTDPTPTGSDPVPGASDDPAASPHGDAAAAASVGATMARETRTVLDTDTAHLTIAGTWRESEAGWCAHLETMTVRKRVESSVACNGAALGPRYLALAAERIVALDRDRLRGEPLSVPRLTVIGVVQTLERISLEGSQSRAHRVAA